MDEQQKTQILAELKARNVPEYCYLHIARVPNNTYKEFMLIANQDDFCQDYGMCLKYLIDVHKGIIQKGNEGIIMELEMLKEELQELKTKMANPNPVSFTDQDKEKIRKTLNGKVIK